MRVDFYKYQGAGNDFILIDNRSGKIQLSEEVIAKYCDRRFGIGADGLILLEKDPSSDFRMVYFNADGKEGTMCGNGGRCVVRFAHDLALFDSDTVFNAVDGLHTASVTTDIVRLKMSDVNSYEQIGGDYFLNTGSPHHIIYVNNIDEVDVYGIGKAIRYGEKYGPKGGVNVNFVEIVAPGHLKVRTYERGVEDETFACGTGVTASVLATHVKEGWNGPVTIDVLGGQLTVEFVAKDENHFTDIYLTGPATFVYRGDIEI